MAVQAVNKNLEDIEDHQSLKLHNLSSPVSVAIESPDLNNPANN